MCTGSGCEIYCNLTCRLPLPPCTPISLDGPSRKHSPLLFQPATAADQRSELLQRKKTHRETQFKNEKPRDWLVSPGGHHHHCIVNTQHPSTLHFTHSFHRSSSFPSPLRCRNLDCVEIRSVYVVQRQRPGPRQRSNENPPPRFCT